MAETADDFSPQPEGAEKTSPHPETVGQFGAGGRQALLDREQVDLHLRLIGIDPKQAYFRALHWNGGGAVDLPPGHPQRRRLGSLQRRGYRLYLIAGGGKADEDVTSIPATFAEWDGLSLKDVEGLLHEAQVRGLPEPTLLITTWEHGSPHVWWKFAKPCTDIPRWRALMDRLVIALGSDPTCTNPSQLMRLAGSAYIAKQGHPRQGDVLGQARILRDNAEAITTIEAMEAWVAAEFARRPELLEIERELARARSRGVGVAKPPADEDRLSSKGKALPPRSMEEVEAALAVIPIRVSGLPEGDPFRHPYHSLVLAGLRDALYRLTEGKEEDRIEQATRIAYELMEAHSPSKECGWDVAQHLRSRLWLDEGVFWRRAIERGWTAELPKKKTSNSSPAVARDAEEPIEDLFAEMLGRKERLAQTRSYFSTDRILPEDLSEAAQVQMANLPVDALSTALPLLGGYSGLLPIGTYVRSSTGGGGRVPTNMYEILVGVTGGAKTHVLDGLVRDPARAIRDQAKLEYGIALTAWKQENKGQKVEDRSPRPFRTRPHISEPTPEALVRLLAYNETIRAGQLIVADELSGLFGGIDQYKQGRKGGMGGGSGEAVYLEAFDGGHVDTPRIEDNDRSYERCHLSIVGGLQPEVFRGLVNSTSDTKGFFARFLPVRLPTNGIIDIDPRLDFRPETNAAAIKAAAMLADYAVRFRYRKPVEYRICEEACIVFYAWFKQHQLRANVPGTPESIAAILRKTSAHARRLAGLLHIARIMSPADPTQEGQEISVEVMGMAMEIVDQIAAETISFHETPVFAPSRDGGLSSIQMAETIHALSWSGGETKEVDCQLARNKAPSRTFRAACTAKAFQAACLLLQGQNLGVFTTPSDRRQAPSYLATRHYER